MNDVQVTALDTAPSTGIDADDALWYKDAVIYQVNVKSFFDSNGYDIADYQNVHPQFGTLDDFRTLLHEAHRLGLKVITELIINHTSDQHPWFQAARAAPAGSPQRDFYVWGDTDQKYLDTRIIFTATATSNWTR